MKSIELSTPHELKQRFTASHSDTLFIEKSRTTSKNILSGKDPRKAIILGPCSIHDPAATLEYAKQFKELAEEVSETCFLIMRVYVEKSRTARGWKGFLHDPHLNGTQDIAKGIEWTRELLLELTALGIPCSTEFVNPLAAPYYEDLISWGFIGARTVCSQPHRSLAATLEMPIGFKNSLDGELSHAVYAIESAREPHNCMGVNPEGKLCIQPRKSNPHTHIILRGGYQQSNYDEASIHHAVKLLSQYNLPERILIDCSHGNAGKCAEKQKDVFENTLDQLLKGNSPLFGWMIESHLNAGSQPIGNNPLNLEYGLSITDPCIDWEMTQELIKTAHLALLPASVG